MRPQPVRLLGYFLTASVVTLAIVTALVAALYDAAEHRDMVRQGRRFAERMVAHLDAQVRAGGVPEGGYFRVPVDPADRERLDASVRRATAGFLIRRLYLYDAEGRVTYGLNPGREGVLVENDESLARALEGATASQLREAREPLHEGGDENVALLETYVPVRDGTGRVAGVIEVYQDAEGLRADLELVTIRIATTAAISVLAAVAVLFLVFLRGDRLIRERTDALAAANAALAELTRDLEKKVEARTADLVARERLALLGTIATGIAHEVNNPLASIVGAADSLLRKMGAGPFSLETQDDCREYLEIIRDEAFRAKAITRDLLDYARRPADTPGPVHPNDLVRSVAALLKLRPRGLPGELELALAPDDALPLLRGSAGKLVQVIFNVTNNAIDALGREGGRIVWTSGVEPDAAQGGAERIVLRCRDDGHGIPKEALPRVFEPFFSTKEPGAGTGLGLAVSHAIIEAHGGTMQIESEGPGRGTTVTIRLPKAGNGEPRT